MLEFTPGFNIVAGQNNSGKTALLEMLSLDFAQKPHRSLKTVPFRSARVTQPSSAELSFTASRAEIQELLPYMGSFLLPAPMPDSAFARENGITDTSPQSGLRLQSAVFSQDALEFSVKRIGVTPEPQWALQREPSYGLYPVWAASGPNHQAFVYNKDSGGKFTSAAHTQSNAPDIGIQFANHLPRHVYRFAAERLKLGRGMHGPNSILARDASNLPEVLGRLNRNIDRFLQLNQEVSGILPNVRRISVEDQSNNQISIVVWSHDPGSYRDDLAIPLEECGTGVGQVVAMVYVVLMSESPQTIIIDEPQSFLHPGAARKLVEFLKRNAKHQFIVATHSATIISAANPSTITLARFANSETTFQQLDAEKEKGIQATMAELGVRLSDAFGADDILWVEGVTEEKCFRLIIEKLLHRSLTGTEILPIRQTGDLEARDARKIFEIYNSLSKGASLLPPAIAFMLDGECRDEPQRNELYKLSANLAFFLPRRMFENYLLNADAIAAVANDTTGFRQAAATAQEIKHLIEKKLGDRGYYCPKTDLSDAQVRIACVDAARILKETFNELSESRVAYDKPRHGLALTHWLIKNQPSDLRDIAELLSHVLKGKPPTEG